MTQSWILVSDDGSTKCVLTTSPVRDFILEKGLRLSGLTIMPYTNQVSRVYAFNTALGIGALVGGMIIYIMGVIGKLIFKKEAMGGGDVKLMAMIGSFLGWKLALFTFFIAPIFGAVFGLVMKMRDGRDTIAYGPYLSLAAVITIFFSKFLLGLLA